MTPQIASENETAGSQFPLPAIKPEDDARPLLIDATFEYPHIILEAFASNAPAAEEFITTIAEPVSRFVKQLRLGCRTSHTSQAFADEGVPINSVLVVGCDICWAPGG